MNLEPMLQAVRKAVILCREVQHGALRGIDKTTARDIEPVTIADYGAQAVLGRAIEQFYPEDAVLAEESGEQFMTLVAPEQRAIIMSLMTKVLDIPVRQDDVVRWLDYGKHRAAWRRWTLDPVDGTKGFIALRHYAVGVGILTDGKPTGAVIGCPAYGDGISGNDEQGLLFYAQDGAAYKSPLFGEAEVVQLHTSKNTDAGKVVLVQSFEEKHGSKERKARVYEHSGFATSKLHELDSMEKYGLIADGQADVCLHIPRTVSMFNIWDHAPGTALVLAAGGSVTGLDGQPLDFSQGDTIPCRGIVISNGAVHDRLLSAVAEVYREDGLSVS